MSEPMSRKLLCRRVNRRSVLQSSAALLSVPFVAKATAAFGQEKLTGTGEVVICSYGGEFTQNLRKYVFEPFRKATGIKVVDATADIAEPQIKAMHEAGRVDWDAVFVTPHAQGYSELSQAGVFAPIDYSLWDDEALKAVPESARHADAVVAFKAALLQVYDKRAFPKGGPKNWADFWNVKEFPGPRGLGVRPPSSMVFALLADGVSRSGLGRLTDNEVDRALKKLDEIKPYIAKWWSAGGEPVQLLTNGEYAISSSSDGRAVGAIRGGLPLGTVWDGAFINDNYWGVLKGGPNTANAQKFIAFVNRTEVAAAFTQATGFAGPNLSQLEYLPADLAANIAINPENAAKSVLLDARWIIEKRTDGKTNGEYIQDRWLAWRAR
ncbi:spermidine/putrescine-binding protein [Bradyrhizobium sp. LM2.7]